MIYSSYLYLDFGRNLLEYVARAFTGRKFMLTSQNQYFVQHVLALVYTDQTQRRLKVILEIWDKLGVGLTMV